MKHAEPHTGCVQSVTGKKKMNTKIYKIQMLRWYESNESDARGRADGPNPMLRPTVSQQLHIREERGMKASKKKKREERDDATRINRVTVWMQHTSLPLTNKAVKRENVVTNEAIFTTAHQSSV